MNFAVIHLVSGPDLHAARQLHDCSGLSDEDSSHILFHQHGWDPKSSFRFGDDAVHLPFYLQRITAACVIRMDGGKASSLITSSSDNITEKQLLTDIGQYLKQTDESAALYAWDASNQLQPLMMARSSLLNGPLAAPSKMHSLCADYIHSGNDNEERQLDYIASLHGLLATERPLNVASDPAGCQLAEKHAAIRAWQLAFLTVRQQQVIGAIDADVGEEFEHTIRQQLNQLAPAQDKI